MKIILNHQPQVETTMTITGDTTHPQTHQLLAYLEAFPATTTKRIAVKRDDKEFFLELTQIAFFAYHHNAVIAVKDKLSYKTTFKLFEIEERFSTLDFVRISKSTVVNLNFISHLEPEFSGNFTIFLQDNTRLTLSRRFVKDFRARLLK